MIVVAHIVGWIALLLAVCGVIYAVIAPLMVRRFMRAGVHRPVAFPAVTLLKPLHLGEPRLKENLESFCTQDYAGPVQIIFGVQDPADPAIAVVEAVKAAHPGMDIALVVDSRLSGANRKMSNIINMFPGARHDVLVLSDSDIAVPRHWLRTVVGALSRPGVGAVSCLYEGIALNGPWSKLAAMGISYHFLPNVVMGTAGKMAAPCFGSTIAITRQVLGEIGGFEVYADYLADDYEMGRVIREKGYEVALPPILVAHGCAEGGMSEWLRHELRWARTICSIDRLGHFGSIVTHSFPLALIAALFLGFNGPALIAVAATLAARVSLKLRLERITGAVAGPVWLLPFRDLCSFGVFVVSFFGTSIHWRGVRFQVEPSGALTHT